MIINNYVHSLISRPAVTCNIYMQSFGRLFIDVYFDDRPRLVNLEYQGFFCKLLALKLHQDSVKSQSHKGMPQYYIL